MTTTEVVCVVGLGYVGLPLAVWWAEESGSPVVGYDHDPKVVSRIASGQAPREPGLTERLRAVLQGGRLTVSSLPPERVHVVAVCVPTPLDSDRKADLSFLHDAVATVAPRTAPGALWLIASTVPVGTTEAVAAKLRRIDPRARVAMCPERVLPGQALHELTHTPRLVGGVDEASTEAARAWFAARTRGPVVPTTAALAELTKLVENASRDAELAVAHAAAEIALEHGLDPYALQSLVNLHPRARMLTPGVGVGGHCLPVDPWFLVEPEAATGSLFAALRRFTDGVPERWVERIRSAYPSLRRVAVLGLSYKAESDDLRNAPALRLARGLAKHYDVVVTDPYVEAPPDLVHVSLDLALDAELVVLAVAHRAFVEKGPPKRSGQHVIDACGGWISKPGPGLGPVEG
ncbi:MAG: nucleotide sugar dehydrogenase [Myxococcota bacterium]